MNETIIYVFTLALFELYESSWQRGSTFGAIINNIYARYKRSVFYLILSHPAFIFCLYLGVAYDLTNFWFLSILFLKFLDISYKLVLAKKIEEHRLAEVLPIPLDMPIQPWMMYLNVILYPLFLYLAFVT
ncbi:MULTISPECIES: hypothetical protein [unclassified Nitratiruptor]|uniref:hypothetical protein n=1 Tax=unclassified Nitratiruptor TaxID=2624044 RepID=UPI001916C414|nr:MULTISPECIES: hypothetical protein [unclassified Nitratiruptor]BCD60756.1 hypothetical protein NitYY0810_C1534 [Nitratiruptor sp. YY08-10]BCD64688.1 hypothetical protein NitYY0814_C1542 [Nitratiruptor sp. YY08-14]